jgi:Flp pilus assembly protein TadG
MTVFQQKPSHRGGAAAVELALIIPLLLTFLLGIWEVGRMIDINQILSNAAREGARQASAGLKTDSQVQQAVIDYLKNSGIPTTHAVVTVSNLTSPGTDSASAAQMDEIQVGVSIPFSDVRWIMLNFVTSSTTTMSAQASWNSVRDQQFPTTVSVPQAY